MMTKQIEMFGGAGILTQKDLEELSAATQRVLALMKDGKWHTADEIEFAAGQNGIPAREGLRRMRELRDYYQIERERLGDSRQWKYRLLITTKSPAKWWEE